MPYLTFFKSLKTQHEADFQAKLQKAISLIAHSQSLIARKVLQTIHSDKVKIHLILN